MIDTLFRGLTNPALAPPLRPELVERESRAEQAHYDAAAGAGGPWSAFRQPATLTDYVQAYTDLVPAFRCASLNAASVAGLKLRFYRDLGGDEKAELDRNHPLSLLFRRPTPRMSTRRWVYANQLSKELTGATYNEIATAALPSFAREGRPALQLWPLHAALVEPKTERRKGIVKYLYWVDTKPEEFSPEEIWEDSFHHPQDELRGLPPMQPAAANVAGERALDVGMNAILQNGMRLSGVLHLDSAATPEQVDSIYAVLREMYQSVRNWGKTLVAPAGRRFESLSMTPEAMQADKLREYNTGSIMRAFGVWPVVFGLVDMSATRENATTQLLLYYLQTVIPRAESLAEEITESLIPRLGIAGTDDVVAEFDYTSSLIWRILAAEQMRADLEAVREGVLTRNEVRAPLGYEPVPWGDSFWAPSRLTEVAKLDDDLGRAIGDLRRAAGLCSDPSRDTFLADVAAADDPLRRLPLLLREAARQAAIYDSLTAGSAGTPETV